MQIFHIIIINLRKNKLSHAINRIFMTILTESATLINKHKSNFENRKSADTKAIVVYVFAPTSQRKDTIL